VLFEKLIYKGIVKKSNRKRMVVMCILIAFKCIEAYGGFGSNEKRFKLLRQGFELFMGSDSHANHAQKKNVSTKKKGRLFKKSLIYYELKILSALNFQTTIPIKYILPHMESIMTVLDTDLSDYLGEEAYNEFMGYRRVAWNRF
jgi:hypothetical protein